MVLDLGPAVGDNVSFFAGHSCKLHIADLYESLFAPTVRHPESARAFRELLANDLPETGDQTVDVILAWDLLNYLKGDQLKALAEALSGYCNQGTQLFAMIATQKDMPAKPSVFRILDSEHIALQQDEQWQRPSPRYTEPDLARFMPDFQVDVSFLLRNGLQEYALNYRPRGRGIGLPHNRPRR